MNYNILVFYPATGEHKFVKVPGYPIETKLAPDVKFFAHRPYNENKELEFESYWNISEYESGLSLITYCVGTKQQTLHAMEARLIELNTDIQSWIKDQKDKSIKLYGVAND